MDFDLSHALQGSPELDERGLESCCLDMTDVHEEIYRLDEGLDLVVSHNPKKMHCVATLLLAVGRMKKPLLDSSRELSDEEFCSVIMDSLVDETVVEMTKSVSTGREKALFRRVSSVNVCTLCDEEHKDVVQRSGELELVAITLKGGNYERKVKFEMSRYISDCSSATEGRPVVLSVTIQKTLHFSCSMVDNSPVLKLEECSEDDLKSINIDTDMGRFLFYRRTLLSLTTFESAQCPGWYISTSQLENQPVEICKMDSTDGRYLNFEMK